MIKSFEDIDNKIEHINSNNPKILAVAAADDEHVIAAICEAKGQKIADSILVGNKKRILEIAREHLYDVSGFQIVDIKDLDEAAEVAVKLVKDGSADILMKGMLDTSILLKAIINKENGLMNKRLLSFVGLFEVRRMGRMIYITDPAINLEPSIEDKEIIMGNAVSLAHALGNKCPKVALICPIEKVNARMDSTIEAKILTEKYRDSEDFYVEGPFALDNAVSREAAKIKNLKGPVAGNADILITHDIGVGNAIYKSLVYFSDTRNAGIVIGAKAPILITSRSDSTDTKLNSIKLGVLLADYYTSL